MNKLDLDDPIAVQEFINNKKEPKQKTKPFTRNEDGILILPTKYAKCGGSSFIRWGKEMWCNDISMKKKRKKNGWRKKKKRKPRAK